MSLLSQVSVVDIRDSDGGNLLQYFTNDDQEFIMRQLIAAGCDVNVGGCYGHTPLMVAVEMNRLRTAKILLDAGASHCNTNYINKYGPLHVAVCFGFKDMVQILLEAGANVNEIDEEFSSPLHQAAKAVPHSGNHFTIICFIM